MCLPAATRPSSTLRLHQTFASCCPGCAPPRLQPGSSEGCRQEAARALSNLSCNNDVDQGGQMVSAGAVTLLVDMMRVRGHPGFLTGPLAPAAESASSSRYSRRCCTAGAAAEAASSSLPGRGGPAGGLPCFSPGCAAAWSPDPPTNTTSPPPSPPLVSVLCLRSILSPALSWRTVPEPVRHTRLLCLRPAPRRPADGQPGGQGGGGGGHLQPSLHPRAPAGDSGGEGGEVAAREDGSPDEPQVPAPKQCC